MLPGVFIIVMFIALFLIRHIVSLHHKGDRYGKQRRVLHDIADVPAGHVYYLYCHGGVE